MKKFLGLVLALVLSLSLPANALAAAPDHTEQIRLQGQTRYETAVSIANELAKQHGIDFSKGQKFENVVLASGNNFPDALAGAPLAAQESAPILLVDNTPESSTVTLNYVQDHVDLKGSVYLLGGTGVIPVSFTQKLVSMGFSIENIKQLGGRDRNETSLLIAQQLKDSLNEVALVDDSTFTDALTVAPTSVSVGSPILLVASTGLTPEQKAFCDAKDAVVIIGSLNSKANQIYPRALGLSGSNKYDTNAIWAKTQKNKPFIVLATGEDYPDALAGAVLSGSLGGGPIFLTRPDALPPEVIDALNVTAYYDKQAFTYTNANGQTATQPAVVYPTLYILGGAGAVSVPVQLRAGSILDGPGYPINQ